MRFFAIYLVLLFPLATCAGDEVKIVRDDFGIPHIFSESDEGVSYGLGYAQAQDRLTAARAAVDQPDDDPGAQAQAHRELRVAEALVAAAPGAAV